MRNSMSGVARWFLALSLLLMAGRALALPAIQTWTTPSGARVFFVENHDLPMIDVSVDFPAGSSFDASNAAGVAALTQLMLRLGAAGLTEDQIATKMADVGAQLSGRFDLDRAGVGVRTLSSERERDVAMGVLASVLQSPIVSAACVRCGRGRA